MAALRRLFLLLLPAVVVAALLAGCQGGTTTPPSTTGAAGPATSAVQPTTPQTTGSPSATLLAAFTRSWRVYADALHRLDASKLGTAFAGNALQAVQSEVAEQKAKHQPVRISVQHHPKVLMVNATDGVVADQGVNHSVVLDPATGKPAEPDPNERFSEHRSFKFLGGTWKVVEIIEERAP
jgi:hypothetical protein